MNTKSTATAACLVFVALSSAWVLAENQDPQIVVRVTSIEGEDLGGVVSVDDIKSAIAEVARDGPVVFRGGLIEGSRFPLERGDPPLDIRVSGSVTIPGHEPAQSAFSYGHGSHLVLHTGKWTVQVLGPREFKPRPTERE